MGGRGPPRGRGGAGGARPRAAAVVHRAGAALAAARRRLPGVGAGHRRLHPRLRRGHHRPRLVVALPLAGLWGGMAGSLLLWSAMVAAWGCAARAARRRAGGAGRARPPPCSPSAPCSPRRGSASRSPALDGEGLTPILEHAGDARPPAAAVRRASPAWRVPLATTVAALAAGRLDDELGDAGPAPAARRASPRSPPAWPSAPTGPTPRSAGAGSGRGTRSRTPPCCRGWRPSPACTCCARLGAGAAAACACAARRAGRARHAAHPLGRRRRRSTPSPRTPTSAGPWAPSPSASAVLPIVVAPPPPPRRRTCRGHGPRSGRDIAAGSLRGARSSWCCWGRCGRWSVTPRWPSTGRSTPGSSGRWRSAAAGVLVVDRGVAARRGAVATSASSCCSSACSARPRARRRPPPSRPARSIEVGGWEVRNDGVTRRRRPHRRRRRDAAARRRRAGHLSPSIVAHPERGGLLAETSLRSTPLTDVLVALRDADDDGRALLEVHVRPLVWWVWWGAALVAARRAAGRATSPRRGRRRRATPARRARSRRARRRPAPARAFVAASASSHRACAARR